MQSTLVCSEYLYIRGSEFYGVNYRLSNLNARLVQYLYYLFTPYHIPHKLKEPTSIEESDKNSWFTSVYIFLYIHLGNIWKSTTKLLSILFVDRAVWAHIQNFFVLEAIPRCHANFLLSYLYTYAADYLFIYVHIHF